MKNILAIVIINFTDDVKKIPGFFGVEIRVSRLLCRYSKKGSFRIVVLRRTALPKNTARKLSTTP